jgi:hypothetical protein
MGVIAQRTKLHARCSGQGAFAPFVRITVHPDADRTEAFIRAWYSRYMSSGVLRPQTSYSMYQLYKKYSNTLLVYAVYAGILAFALACSLDLL